MSRMAGTLECVGASGGLIADGDLYVQANNKEGVGNIYASGENIFLSAGDTYNGLMVASCQSNYIAVTENGDMDLISRTANLSASGADNVTVSAGNVLQLQAGESLNIIGSGESTDINILAPTISIGSSDTNDFSVISSDLIATFNGDVNIINQKGSDVGITMLGDNIGLATSNGYRPHINNSGIATLDDIVGGGNIDTINGENGPAITIIGNDSISVQVPTSDVIQIYASGLYSSGVMDLQADDNVNMSGKKFTGLFEEDVRIWGEDGDVRMEGSNVTMFASGNVSCYSEDKFQVGNFFFVPGETPTNISFFSVETTNFASQTADVSFGALRGGSFTNYNGILIQSPTNNNSIEIQTVNGKYIEHVGPPGDAFPINSGLVDFNQETGLIDANASGIKSLGHNNVLLDASDGGNVLINSAGGKRPSINGSGLTALGEDFFVQPRSAHNVGMDELRYNTGSGIANVSTGSGIIYLTRSTNFSVPSSAAAAQLIPWDSEEFIDPSYYIHNSTDIYVTVPGIYKITYHVSTDTINTNITRTGCEIICVKNGSRTVAGSLGYTYNRTVATGKDTAAWTGFEKLDAYEYIGISVQEIGAATADNIAMANGCSFSMEYIRPLDRDV